MTTKTKQKIVRSMAMEALDHRSDFEHCPRCGVKFETDKWDECAIVLILDEVYGKHGSVTVVSECPKCFERSWVHQTFGMFSEYMKQFSEAWKTAAKAEEGRRHLASIHEFVNSLCSQCIHLRSLDLETHAWRECTLGKPPTTIRKGCFLDSGPCETECPKFQKRP